MQVIITEQTQRGVAIKAQSVCGRYTWFVATESAIHDTLVGRQLTTLGYTKLQGFGSDPIDADTQATVRAFWAGLRVAQAQAEQAAAPRVAAMEAEEMARYNAAEALARVVVGGMHSDADVV